MAMQPLVLPSDPVPHGTVHGSQSRRHGSLVKASIGVAPASQDWMEHAGQGLQRLGRLQLEAPAVERLAPRLGRLVADARRAGEPALTVAVRGPSWSQGISQTITLRLRVCPTAGSILTGMHPRLLWREPPATRLEACPECVPQVPGFTLRATGPHAVLGITCPGIAGKGPGHPCVNHVRQAPVGPHGTHDATLRGPRRPLSPAPGLPRPGGFQPSGEVQQAPCAGRVRRDSPQPQRMSDRVTASLAVVCHPPVVPPAPLARHFHGL
jgi:hypothetical protein